jgi:hypothetical protein
MSEPTSVTANTVARMAGNIASGLAERQGIDGLSTNMVELIAVAAVSITKAILNEMHNPKNQGGSHERRD